MTKPKAIKVPRNVTALHMKQKSSKIAHKGDRRAKDNRRNFKNEEW